MGTLELTWNGEPLVVRASLKVRSLLAYLIFHHGQCISRDRLAGFFWPERPDARARRALSQALWQVRSALGPAADRLTAEREDVTFDLRDGDWLDAAEFERLAGGSDLRALTAAVDLCRAEFLEGIYDDWVLLERERLRELFLRALERLIVLHKQRGDYERALAYAQRLAAADPLREEAHRELMQLYHLLGRSQAALEQFVALRDLLTRELGARPTAATVALYQEIVAALAAVGAPHLPVAPPSPPLLRDLAHLPLVGRVEERAALLSALQAAIQARGGYALVEGDAGVGKTRLVGEIVADARWRGFQVGLAKANHLAASAPYQLFQEALSAVLTPLRVAQLAELVEPVWLGVVVPILPAIAEHLPDLPAPAPLDERGEEQRRLWEGLSRCLAGLAAIAPLLLVLEDVHWADEATLAALPHLASVLPRNRALVILTCRSVEARERAAVWEALDGLDRASPLLRLRLMPFELAETVGVLGRALGADEADAQVASLAGRLQGETGGNALFLVESLRALLEERALMRSPDGQWLLSPERRTPSVPASMHEIIGERLQRLGAVSRAALELVAVLGEDADFPVLARAGDMPPSALLPALEELRRCGFLLETEARFRFEHDRVREVVYQAIDAERRQQRHCRVGEVMEALYPDRVESLAFHFEKGGLAAKAFSYLTQAGERAVALHAYRTALDYYDRAAAVMEKAGVERFELLAARESVLDVLGERARQAADLKAMVALSSDDMRRAAQARRREAWFLAHAGQYEEAQEAARRALALAEQEGDRLGQAAALAVFGQVVDWAGSPSQAVPYLERAVALYQGEKDSEGEAQAGFALGSALLGVKAYAEAEVALERTLSLRVLLGDWLGEAETMSALGILYMERGDTERAVVCYERALKIGREIGYRYGEARAAGNLGTLFYMQGRIGRALEMYGVAISIFQAIGQRRGEAQMRVNRASVHHSMLGGNDACLADARAALAYYREAGDEIGQGQCLSVMGQMVLQDGRLDEARAHLESGLALLLGAGERWIAVQVYAHMILLALQQKRPQDALRHVEEADAICQELGLADLAISMLALRGLVLLALGQPEAALAATDAAVERAKPGVEQLYLVFYWRYLVLSAVGRAEEAHTAVERAWQLLSEALEGLSSAQRRASLTRVPEHRAIAEAWQATQVQRVVVRLPRVGAPTGRPLREDEWVDVSWTVASPEDAEVSGKAERRRHQLLRLLREAAEQSAAPTVEDLAAALGVNERTIRRDLEALRAAGHAARTRGDRS
ncbi:MAG: tetratricopeptide repeat protein [Anaerolineae bacterium]|nr:tetratricopeptide repeat protein [Anaerolineae bacterium]